MIVMNTYRLRIACPTGVIYDGDAVKLCVRSVTGDLAVLHGHIPFATTVVEGICKVTDGAGDTKTAKCSGGLLTVSKECTNLLVTHFEWN